MPVSIESKTARKQIEFIANRQCAEVLAVLREYPEGLTRCEIAEASGLRIQSVAGRCNDLLKAGVLRKKPDAIGSASYERRQTDSGRMACVLELA